MSLMVPELAVKRLELLRELVPGISRVLVLSYLADPIAPLQVNAMEGAAGPIGMTLQVRDIRTVDDIPAAFEAGTRERAEGLLLTTESMFIVHRARVTELAARDRLPAVYSFRSAGSRETVGSCHYDVRTPDLHRQRRHICPPHSRREPSPPSYRSSSPRSSTLIINLRAARALGLTIPPTLLARADEVIE